MSFWLGEKTHLKKKKPDLNQVLSGFFSFWFFVLPGPVQPPGRLSFELTYWTV
jgi:hypothetical protein